jgi:hypothetical protein
MHQQVRIWASAALFAVAGLFVAANAWAEEEAGWQAKIDSGLELIKEKNFELAGEQFSAAAQSAMPGIELAIARYYQGYVWSLGGDMQAADRILEEAQQVSLDEKISDKQFLVALYGLRKQVANALGDEIRAVTYAVLAAANRAYDQNIWKTEDGSGLVTHKRSGVKMPITLGKFSREDVSAFQRSGKDVSVSYEQFIDGEKVRVTFYLTETGVIRNTQGQLFTEAGYFENVASHIKTYFSNLEKVEEGTFAIPGRPDLTPLALILTGNHGSAQRNVVTGLLVEEAAGMFLKVRYTYSASLGFEGRMALEALLADFDWPKASTRLSDKDIPLCGKQKSKKSKSSVFHDMAAVIALSLTYTLEMLEDTPGEDDAGTASDEKIPTVAENTFCQLKTFEVGNIKIIPFMSDELKGNQPVRYRFEFRTSSSPGEITLGSSNKLNTIVSELAENADEPNSPKRVFHLDYRNSDKVTLIEMFKGEPSYRTVKRLIKLFLKGKESGLMSVIRDDEGNTTIQLNSDGFEK